MKIFCNNCNRHTKHKILQEYKKSFYPEDTPDMEIDFAHGAWQIICCAGCGIPSFREVWVTSDDLNSETGQPEEVETLYPKRSAHAIAPKDLFNVPQKLRRLYFEVIDCYNYDHYILCAAGLRAMIEGICSEQGVNDGVVNMPKGEKRKSNLEGKIEGLHQKGILAREHARTLHEHRYLGNDAIHEIDYPARVELEIGIEVLEHTLEHLYELSNKREKLQAHKDLRKKLPKAST